MWWKTDAEAGENGGVGNAMALSGKGRGSITVVMVAGITSHAHWALAWRNMSAFIQGLESRPGRHALLFTLRPLRS